jgi:hypothetical protein
MAKKTEPNPKWPKFLNISKSIKLGFRPVDRPAAMPDAALSCSSPAFGDPRISFCDLGPAGAFEQKPTVLIFSPA